MNTCRS
jgi:hypothetical protein